MGVCTHSGFNTITVANATPTLRTARLAAIEAQNEVREQCEDEDSAQCCHVLASGVSAAGVLEGLTMLWPFE